MVVPSKVALFFLDIIMLILKLIFCGFSVGALQGHQDRGECEHQQGVQRQDLCFGQVRQLTLEICSRSNVLKIGISVNSLQLAH